LDAEFATVHPAEPFNIETLSPIILAVGDFTATKFSHRQAISALVPILTRVPIDLELRTMFELQVRFIQNCRYRFFLNCTQLWSNVWSSAGAKIKKIPTQNFEITELRRETRFVGGYWAWP
jgi:hypothetical protein